MPRKLRSSMGAAPSPTAGGESHTSERSPAASRRWTRSRARDIGLDATDHPRADPEAPAGAALKKRKRVQAAASASAGPVPKKTRLGEGQPPATASTTLASRPLPPRYPPYPTAPVVGGQRILTKKHRKAVFEWMDECRRIAKLSRNQAEIEDIPTLRDEPSDPLTADTVVSSADKAVVLRVARSVVSVSSTKPDGKKVFLCSGFVIDWDGANKCSRILTSSFLVCNIKGELHDPALKLSVCLPNNTITEAQLIFFNVHYGVALLEVVGDFQLQIPSFGSSANYGQDVSVLARDGNMSLMVRHGTISWLDYPMLCYNHFMFLSCDIPKGAAGGPVIDHDGNISGIALDIKPGPVVTSISTIKTCIDMWHQSSRVARPMLGMQLKAVELLDVARREELCLKYNITGGFIVNLVKDDSTAERIGIRRGDVIVFENNCSTLPQLEDYLLSLGWGYLQGTSLTVDLKMEVHNLVDSYKECITFPVEFSESSEEVD
ncbi:uncharacterized protein LOC102721967 isoform X1 [Oryza brachyantha]|uniref:uncharacterized protein LOC102721967 isoform X1 n=1 Tax=Oryza brachyantha TaxID=4533 RepID=UPI0003EA9551|nr:uncharacterized protein LOC102721967 isoform X1 [Oryza brachyantha]